MDERPKINRCHISDNERDIRRPRLCQDEAPRRGMYGGRGGEGRLGAMGVADRACSMYYWIVDGSIKTSRVLGLIVMSQNHGIIVFQI